MHEQLAKLAQRERESAPTTDLDEGTPTFFSERERANTENEKTEMLVSHTCCEHTRSLSCTFYVRDSNDIFIYILAKRHRICICRGRALEREIDIGVDDATVKSDAD